MEDADTNDEGIKRVGIFVGTTRSRICPILKVSDKPATTTATSRTKFYSGSFLLVGNCLVCAQHTSRANVLW